MAPRTTPPAASPSSGQLTPPTGPPARTATALAAQILAADATIADLSSTAEAVRRAGEFQQLASRALAGAAPRFRHRVLSRLRGRAAAVMVADVKAAVALDALTSPAPSLPHDWRIVGPLPPARLLRLYRAASDRSGVPWEYLAAINFVETKLGRIIGPSTAGAQGPMQFMPGTWAEYGAGGDIRDPRDAIPAAARLLAAHGAPAEMARALRAYNNSAAYGYAVSAYASVLRRWPRTFVGYWCWRVLYKTRSGVFVLPVGYPANAARRIESR